MNNSRKVSRSPAPAAGGGFVRGRYEVWSCTELTDAPSAYSRVGQVHCGGAKMRSIIHSRFSGHHSHWLPKHLVCRSIGANHPPPIVRRMLFLIYMASSRSSVSHHLQGLVMNIHPLIAASVPRLFSGDSLKATGRKLTPPGDILPHYVCAVFGGAGLVQTGIIVRSR